MTVFAVVQLTQHIGEFLLAMPLYIGPDVFLPITSALAAIVGVLLMFWNRVVTFVARLFGRGAKASVTQASEHKPDRPN